MSQHHRMAMREYYDELGEQGRDRLTRDLPGRVSLEIHRRFLARFVRPGQRVLKIGAGPGRFTTVLAGLARELLDVCDASRYADGEFDVVVAYGGPHSYAFERTEEALRGLRRLTGPDGVVVASVTACAEPGALDGGTHLLFAVA